MKQDYGAENIQVSSKSGKLETMLQPRKPAMFLSWNGYAQMSCTSNLLPHAELGQPDPELGPLHIIIT